VKNVLRAASLGPPIAAFIAALAAWLTPGYDAATKTVSRLAVPGAPAAILVDASIALVAFTCFLLAAGLSRGRPAGRFALTIAGLGLGAAALIHLDPASAASTWAHRAASGVAVAGLALAPLLLARDYGAICLVAGAAEVAILVLGAVLLATPFGAWGAWERVLLAIPLAWMVLMALTSVSAHARASASKAILRRSGSAAPERSVTSANP
jgi:Protein of unknown function (DUF998)